MFLWTFYQFIWSWSFLGLLFVWLTGRTSWRWFMVSSRSAKNQTLLTSKIPSHLDYKEVFFEIEVLTNFKTLCRHLDITSRNFTARNEIGYGFWGTAYIFARSSTSDFSIYLWFCDFQHLSWVWWFGVLSGVFYFEYFPWVVCSERLGMGWTLHRHLLIRPSPTESSPNQPCDGLKLVLCF